jgi:hypothetical protein
MEHKNKLQYSADFLHAQSIREAEYMEDVSGEEMEIRRDYLY